LLPIVAVDGTDVVLLTVEAWPMRIRVRLTALPDAMTDRLDADYAARMLEWQQRGVERPDEDFPEMPGSAFFGRLRFSLRDAAGTPYAMEGGQSAGSGSEWETSWQFRPGLPVGLDEIEVVVQTITGEHSVRVAV
jgi:hypothetical protein